MHQLKNSGGKSELAEKHTGDNLKKKWNMPLYKYYHRLQIRFFHAVAKWIYPNDEDRAIAFGAESAELFSIVCFREGWVMENVVISHHPEGGYIVRPMSKNEAYK